MLNKGAVKKQPQRIAMIAPLVTIMAILVFQFNFTIVGGSAS